MSEESFLAVSSLEEQGILFMILEKEGPGIMGEETGARGYRCRLERDTTSLGDGSPGAREDMGGEA